MKEKMFFRDLDCNQNLHDGLLFHAAGVVYADHTKRGKGNHSGKDYAVLFFDPFRGFLVRQWRSVDEVEVMIVHDIEYELVMDKYDNLVYNDGIY